MSPRPRRPAGLLRGIWLSLAPPRAVIDALALELLEPNLPSPLLRQAVLEELTRPVKRTDLILEYLGLRGVGTDAGGDLPLVLVSPVRDKDPWRQALLEPGGDCPIGLLVTTRDRGRVALVHEVFYSLSEAEQDLVRRYAALARRGRRHEHIVRRLGPGDAAPMLADVVVGARRRVESALDPSVLLSPDGDLRVQLGSLSETTRNLLREGLRGEYVFILPHLLFEGRTNYADIEFLIYLNFFLRQGQRTPIVGTARQCQTLRRLLTLVIFGLFDPDASEVVPFERVHEDYGVPDPATYEFLRVAYETYAVRATPGLASPILGIDTYVALTVLENGETVTPVYRQGPSGPTRLGEVRVTTCAGGGLDVRITQADGRVASKQMEVTARRRPGPTVRDDLARPIRFATDRPRFGVTPLGTSHGFDPLGDVTSFVVWVNGRGILVDPSPEALMCLQQIGVAAVDVPYAFLTHVHADHDGGLIEKLLGGSRTTVIASDVVFRALVEKVQLVTGHHVEREGLVAHVPADPGSPVTLVVGGEAVTLETRWNLHPIPTNGFKITVSGRSFGYSGDTQYDPGFIARLREQEKLTAAQHDHLMHFFWTPEGTPTVDLLYHEAGIPPIHTARATLQALPEVIQARTFLVHIADKDVPDGARPAKPPLFTTQVLLPPTEAMRREILLDTFRLVSYLYDIPRETLEALTRGARIRRYDGGEVIIGKGPLPKDAALSFYVVADGEVAVRDGRRLIAVLGKGDSFGEWGISHQRGFRVADVVATRPCQCMELGEEQYRWLVARHPVIQERIGQIRRLLPRLQLAQARARQKAAADPSTRLSIIATMTSTQLASFALFSTVSAFKEGQHVISEGAEADGFYILLSGHLAVSMDGQIIGELSEGDVFGETGLLEGDRRATTVSVVSADAEVLFMSTENFRDLLHAAPAFALAVRETAVPGRVPLAAAHRGSR